MAKLIACIVFLGFVAAVTPLSYPISPFAAPKFAPKQPAYHAVPTRVSGPDANAQILRSESDIQPDGTYSFSYETDNGIQAQEQGQHQQVGPEQVVKSAQGSFAWTSPEGQPIQISYIADENGYQPQGDLPTPPPIPAAIQRALEWIAAHPQPEEPTRRF